MTKRIVLLRGINVGGNNKLPMVVLRKLLTDSGCKSVATYIQSGNAVVDATLSNSALESRLERALERELGLSVP
ncbi:MAG: DUF1697 domain-containing protein, partial [Pseudomonadota bacterium]